MCHLSDYFEQKGIEKGIEQGVIQSIINIMESMKCSIDEAMKLLKVDELDKDKYKLLIVEMMK